MKKGGKRQDGQGGVWGGVLCALAKGSAAALLMTLLLLFGCSAAVSAQWLGQHSARQCVILTCVLGALGGSVVAMRNRREWAMGLGLGTGGALFLMLMSIGILLYESAPVPELVPENLFACLCGGAVAGILGRKPKKKRRR